MTEPLKVSDEALAVLFHETYERLAPSFGYETRPDTKAFDPTSANGRLMIAVCGEVGRSLREQVYAGAIEDAARVADGLRHGIESKPKHDTPTYSNAAAWALASDASADIADAIRALRPSPAPEQPDVIAWARLETWGEAQKVCQTIKDTANHSASVSEEWRSGFAAGLDACVANILLASKYDPKAQPSLGSLPPAPEQPAAPAGRSEPVVPAMTENPPLSVPNRE